MIIWKILNPVADFVLNFQVNVAWRYWV